MPKLFRRISERRPFVRLALKRARATATPEELILIDKALADQDIIDAIAVQAGQTYSASDSEHPFLDWLLANLPAIIAIIKTFFV